jgi:hypothetical protein
MTDKDLHVLSHSIICLPRTNSYDLKNTSFLNNSILINFNYMMVQIKEVGAYNYSGLIYIINEDLISYRCLSLLFVCGPYKENFG